MRAATPFAFLLRTALTAALLPLLSVFSHAAGSSISDGFKANAVEYVTSCGAGGDKNACIDDCFQKLREKARVAERSWCVDAYAQAYPGAATGPKPPVGQGGNVPGSHHLHTPQGNANNTTGTTNTGSPSTINSPVVVGGNNSAVAPSGAKPPSDPSVDSMNGRIDSGEFLGVSLEQFLRNLFRSGLTPEQIERIRSRAEKNPTLFKQESVPGQRVLPPTEGEQPKKDVTQADLDRTTGPGKDFLSQKGISKDNVADRLGIDPSAIKAADFDSAKVPSKGGPVVVGGNFSITELASRSSRGAPVNAAGYDRSRPSKLAQETQKLQSAEESRQALYFAQQAGNKMNLGDYEGAVKDATLALAKNPANSGALLLRAAAFNHLGRFDDAIADADSAIRLQPGNASAYNTRAWALAQKGNYKDSYADASKSIELDPGVASAYFNRSQSAEKLGDFRRMLEDLREASRLDSSYEAKLADAFSRYGDKVPGFEYKGAAFPQAGQSARGDSSEQGGQQGENTNWKKVYMVLGGLLVGVVILMQILKATAPLPKTQAHTSAMSQYLILRQIGEGGMGVVYEGYDKTLKRKVAIKRMRTDFAMSDAAREQILNEARTVASLHHPNIVEIYTLFEEGGDLCLVFELIEGHTLGTRLEKLGRMSWQEARPVFESICKALSYAHNNGVIHRDLKPSNIMITSDGTVKVMDFGVARQEEASGKGTKTISGTPAYMSPEQQRGYVRKESDIYSLGVCLYEVLTGYVPWELEGYEPGKNKVIPPSKAVPSLPVEVDALVDAALRDDPDKRIKTPAQFMEMLQAIG